MGASYLCTAARPLANGTSQPSAEQTIANLREQGFRVDLDDDALHEVSRYFTSLAAELDLPVGAPVEYDVSVYKHQLPGGMTSTLRRQLAEIGMEHRWHDILDELPRVREELGWPIMVTPLSQFVGVQAFLNVTSGERWSRLPDEVIRYVLGQYGPPAGEIDPDLKARVQASPRAEELAGEEHGMGLEAARARYGDAISDEQLLLRMMLPEQQVEAIVPSARRRPLPPDRHPLRSLVEGLVDAVSRRRRDRAARTAATSPPGTRRMTAFSGVEAVVFDVDGTLLHTHDPNSVRGATAIPGAVEAVERVRASGRPVLFFTNGTGRPPADYAADLRTVGFTLTDEEFMNPAVVAARWIERRHPGKTVLVLGAPGVVAPLKERGIAVIEGSEPRVADVVLVGWDQVLTYDALRAACDSVWAGAPLLATSTARTFSVNGGPAPGWSGAVVAGIRQTTGRRALTLGKPSPAALQEMSRVLGVAASRTAVVGDDLSLEIAMARRAGAAAALVLTGISTEAEARSCPPERAPDAILTDVSSFPELLSGAKPGLK